MNYLFKSLMIAVFAVSTVFTVTAQEKENKILTTEFKVAGVCDMCKARIENAALIKGVKKAEWNKETQLVTVIYNTKKTSEENIHKAIAEIGHDTNKVKAQNNAANELPKCCGYRSGVEKH